MPQTLVSRWWARVDQPGWKNFGLGMGALGLALLLALYSAAARESGEMRLAAVMAALALGIAGWVGVKIVPALARRTALRWMVVQIRFRLTREGIVYVSVLLMMGLAALNTGNNLLFLILSAMLAVLLMSGVLSTIVLTGNEIEIELPEQIFAGQPALAAITLFNHKESLPSFSLRVGADTSKAVPPVFRDPVYFPYVSRHSHARQQVELLFPRRGIYRQDAFVLRTKFPFGFLEKWRRVESPVEALVYPVVEPTEEFYEILPMVSGEIESLHRGRGHDLYSIRDYQNSDSARHVDWKATARTGELKVREFAREDERQVVLVFDPLVFPEAGRHQPTAAQLERFERGVKLAACLAWHFYELDAELEYRTERLIAPMARASDNIWATLRDLAVIAPRVAAPGDSLLARLPEEPHLFKIILTSQERGTVPTQLWTSAYVIFM
ncbi:MAG TPA: DUF58 domain-containing protein [Candidatus Binatia bacterium]|nr:DUF58 domain-containing protein [Candidatus Binatia bacterium]